jgi:hypothetical protein
VALSLRSPSLAVNQHPALWSSDFPQTGPFGTLPATTQLTQLPIKLPWRVILTFCIGKCKHPSSGNFWGKEQSPALFTEHIPILESGMPDNCCRYYCPATAAKMALRNFSHRSPCIFFPPFYKPGQPLLIDLRN